MSKTFTSAGEWYKGCLHCHTTNSDGALSPSEVLRLYKGNGYHFVSITDHGKITQLTQEPEGILFIPGEEMSVGTSKCGEGYHVISIGADREPRNADGRGPDAVRRVVDGIVDNDGLAFIAHPYWSGLLPEDLMGIDGLSGIEIFNTGCEAEVAKGFSTVHWDQIIALGGNVRGIAVDDAHRYIHPPYDALGGWIWVKAEELSWENIASAMRAGSFYSTMGPEIRLLELGGTVKVRCSGAKQISMISRNGNGIVVDHPTMRDIVRNWRDGRSKIDNVVRDVDVDEAGGVVELRITLSNGRELRVVSSNGAITEAECGLNFFKDYIRVEVTDTGGKKAWTNPIPLT